MHLYDLLSSMIQIMMMMMMISISIIQGQLCKMKFSTKYVCFCNNQLTGDSNANWEIVCIDRETHEEIFTIVHSINIKISIHCYKQVDYENIFEVYEFSDIHHFNFINCSLPSKPFSAVLSKYKVKNLEFINQKNLKNLEDHLFFNFSSLEHLSLKNNGIQTLSSRLFHNLSNLKSLQLNHNNINILSEDTFSPLKYLVTLSLTGNNISNLPTNIFLHLSNLETLFLNINKLTKLHVDLFLNLTELKYLDLSQNKLEQLPVGIFNNIVKIKCIKLGGNNFHLLPERLFIQNINLEKLDMSYNPKITLPNNIFYGLYKMKDLRLHNCNLSFIPKNIFSHLSKLDTLHLWNNRLKTLPKELFSKNLNLRTLNMDFNDLEFLPDTIFEKQFKLSNLKLSKNNIQMLSKGIFNNLVELQTLNLSSNFISEIHKDSFNNLQKLSVLDLSHNRIFTLPNDTSIGFIKNLKIVNFSFNNLTEIPNIFWRHNNLNILNFINNQLNYFSMPIIYSNVRIFLQNNKIKTITIKDFRNNNNLTKFSLLNIENQPEFYFQGNPLNCDCHLHNFINYIKINTFMHSVISFPDAKYLRCYTPVQLNNKFVVSIPDDKFSCLITNNCPSFCSCYLKYDSVVVVNCSNINLISLPSTLPFNSSIVFLDNNKIDYIDLNNSQWENVTEIYLNNNKIKTIQNIKILKNLRILNLQNNFLSSFDDNLVNNYSLYLANNPWVCDCSTLPFKIWLSNNYQKIYDINNITCNFHGIVNVSIIKIPANKFCDIFQMQKILILATLCTFPILLLIIISVFYYRNRQFIIAYLYMHFNSVFHCLCKEVVVDENKIYDAFVSYSSSDQDIVEQMIEELENNEPYFKLCIHERDWLAGNYISCNIVNSVQNSRRTILILSEDYLKSLWCQTEFHAAYYQTLEDKIDRLIIIIRGKFPIDNSLDKDLKYFLSTKTYLKWGEKWFWEKLRYAMPHHKRNLQPIKQISTIQENLFNKFSTSYKSTYNTSEEDLCFIENSDCTIFLNTETAHNVNKS